MAETKVQGHQIVNQSTLPVLGAAARAQLDVILGYLNQNSEEPLRLSATFPTPDAILHIAASRITLSDGRVKTVRPVGGSAQSSAASTINFQTGAITPGAGVLVSGGAFALPASVTGQFRRCALVLRSDGKIDTNFSANSASYGGLTNPGSVIGGLNGLQIGWIDLVGTTTATPGTYKTASSAGSSATNIVENSVGGVATIFSIPAADGSSATVSDVTIDLESEGSLTVAAGTTKRHDNLIIQSPDVWTINGTLLCAESLVLQPGATLIIAPGGKGRVI